MATEENKAATEAKSKSPESIYLTGIVLLAMSVFLFFLFFYPVIREELKYQLKRDGRPTEVLTKSEAEKTEVPAEDILVPVDEKFGIVIPKIAANAKVFPNVDPQNSNEYQKALTKGVAEADGSVDPGELGNIFIFAHSGVDFYEAARYNAVFYLINKLEKGDEIYLFHDKNKFTYRVTDKKIVTEDRTEYLAGDLQKKTVTLMTCWPPGTTCARFRNFWDTKTLKPLKYIPT